MYVVFRLMFAIYIFFTALVLVNLLIAMMTNRYDGAKRLAECTWRFNAVAFGLRVERLVAAVLNSRWCRCIERASFSQCYRDPALAGRYLLDVREKKRAMTLDSGQQRLLEDISQLRTQVRDIADRIDSLRHRCE